MMMDGLKTGSTPFAGYNFTGTATRDGQRFISVVMNTGSKGGYKARFDETRKIIDFAFNNFTKEKLFQSIIKLKGKRLFQ